MPYPKRFKKVVETYKAYFATLDENLRSDTHDELMQAFENMEAGKRFDWSLIEQELTWEIDEPAGLNEDLVDDFATWLYNTQDGINK